MKQYACGAIVFLKDGQRYPVMGKERITLLLKAYRRDPLPEGVELAGDTGGGPIVPITWGECNWESCWHASQLAIARQVMEVDAALLRELSKR